jgi:hypothetical protein
MQHPSAEITTDRTGTDHENFHSDSHSIHRHCVSQ